MESISWMSDYLPVHMLAMGRAAELRFEECLLSCPKTGDGVIRIDDPRVFTTLLENRISSILLSLAAFESYLSYHAGETAKRIEADSPGITLNEFMEKNNFSDFIREMPNRTKRRHELIVEENGDKPVKRFLTVAGLALEDKMLYWLLIRSGKMISHKEGYIKKLLGIVGLRDELLHPNLEIAPELRKISDVRQIHDVFLHHDLPAVLTPGKSCSDEYVVEHYNQGHFLWEVLHCYPPRVVCEVIQYIHTLDGSENHFISAIRLAEMVDPEGRPITEPTKKYTIEVNLGD